jgi:hypothetical protein
MHADMRAVVGGYARVTGQVSMRSRAILPVTPPG